VSSFRLRMDDQRFKGIATDARFRPLPSRFRKVKIDDRFKGMFTEKRFKMKCTVDERCVCFDKLGNHPNYFYTSVAHMLYYY